MILAIEMSMEAFKEDGLTGIVQIYYLLSKKNEIPSLSESVNTVQKVCLPLSLH